MTSCSAFGGSGALSGGVSTVSGLSVGFSASTASAGVFGGSVVVSVLIGSAGASTVVAAVSGASFCSVANGAVVSALWVSMTDSVYFGVVSVVFSGDTISATVVSVSASVCILDKVSDGFTTEHALIRSASSKMMIFFMAFASFRVYGSEKREKTPMCKNQICRFDGDGIL